MLFIAGAEQKMGCFQECEHTTRRFPRPPRIPQLSQDSHPSVSLLLLVFLYPQFVLIADLHPNTSTLGGRVGEVIEVVRLSLFLLIIIGLVALRLAT